MRIGIYGGVFNPVHNGHVALADYILKSGYVDKLVILPTAIPPHKELPLATIKQRFDMVLLAFGQENPFLTFSDFECQSEVSYTYKSVKYFKKSYPQDELFVVVGIDSILQLKNWKNVDSIIENVTFIVFPREKLEILKLEKIFTNEFINEKMFIVKEFKPVSISSTFLREKIINGKIDEITPYLDKKVLKYILENKLYKKRVD